MGVRLLFGLALLLGAASSAQAAGALCSDYENVGTTARPSYVVDGSKPGVYAQVASNSTFGIDADCTIRNFPGPSGFPITNINFDFPRHQDYVIVFDNVFYLGNMSCQDPTFSDFWMWWVNGSYNTISPQCQAFMLPVDAIRKNAPTGQTTAAIGVPFKYTLTMPVMVLLTDDGYEVQFPVTDDSALADVHVYDDLTKTGADLEYLGNTAYLKNANGTTTLLGSLANLGTSTNLHFTYANIPVGAQLVVEIEVVLRDSATNAIGTRFSNTATWTFDKTINNIFKDNLPGQNGVSETLTIAGPDLAVTKGGPGALGVNLGEWGTFTLDVWNRGTGDAWNVTLVDKLPDGATGGMCDLTPQILSAQITGGVTPRTLTQGTDFSFSYTGPSGAPACELTLAMLTDAARIAPGEHLVITYQSKLDANSTTNGVMLKNIAAASQWFNGSSSNTTRKALACTPTPYTGTVGTTDCQDAHEVMVALNGMFFEKTAQNLTTPGATVAASGDTLRYTLRLFSVNETRSNLSFYDNMGALNASAVFVPNTLRNVTISGSTGTNVSNPSGGTNGAGVLDVRGLSVVPGGEITVTFDITLAQAIADGTWVQNQAELMQGTTRVTLSDDPTINGQANPDPAVVDEDVTRVRVQTRQPPLKAIVPTKTEATIGETVTYRITVPGAPYADAINGVVVNDTLNTALVYDSATVTLNGAPLAVSPTQSGQALSWNLGAIPAGQQAVITLTARVANSGTTDAGDTFANTASYTYTGATQPLVSLPTAAIRIIEPQVAVTKGVIPATPPTAGDILSYTVNLAAATGANYSGAFDTGVVDTLSLGLAYVSGSARVGGVAVEPVITGDGVATAQTLTWSGIDVAEAATVAVTYDVRVLNSVGALQTLTNSVTARWTSLEGDFAYERTGTGTPAYNDYVATATTSLTTPPDATTLAKTRLTDTFNAADANLRVGDLVDYELRVGLQEGSHTGLVLKDILPAGLAFEGVVSADFFGTPGTATPTQSGQTLTWNLGDVVNTTADNNPANDFLVIVYRARVMNNDALSQTPATQILPNAATLDYTVGGAAATQLTASTTVSVQQPMLAVNKTAAAGADSPIVDAGETVSFTVDIANSGAAPAYDTVLVDTLPAGLRQGGVTVTSISLVNAGTTLPVLAPAYVAGTGVATWNFDNGTADTYTIPAGETLRVVYTVTADAGLGAGLTLTNSAQATLYYSFDDEAVPANGAVDEREIYGPTNTANETLVTQSPNPPLKANTQPTATIGEQFTYTITVPASPVNAALSDVRILDDLSASSADLALVSARIQGGAALSNTGSGNNVILGADGSIDVPANGQVVVEVTVELQNTSGNNAGLAFNNSASYTYINGSGVEVGGGASVTADMAVVEPTLTATKTVRNVTPGKNAGDPAAGGDILEYVVTIPNTGNATAYDVNIADILPASLTLNGAFTPMAVLQPSGSSISFDATPQVINGATVWGRANGDGTLDVPAGQTLVLTYRVNVADASSASIANRVYVDWTSLDNLQSGERTGANCGTAIPIAAPNDYCVGPATATVNTVDTNAIVKSAGVDSWDSGLSTANDAILRVGDTVNYRVAVTLREGQTRNVVVTDVLPAGLAFDGVVSINGDTTAAYSGAGVFSYADIPAASVPAAGQTGTLTWNLGNLTNAVNNNTADDTFVIEYRARVVNDVLAHVATTPLTNNVTLAYTGADPAATRLHSSATVAVRQPVITGVSKTDRLGRVGTQAAPLNVNVVTDVMQFRLEACNDSGSTAPAYNLLLSDVLASELNEASVSLQAVSVGGVALAAADYAYTAPSGRGGTLTVRIQTPVNPGQCATVDYNVGFHTDIAPNLTWTNSVTASEYWSLPAANGEQYLPVGPAEFWMTNTASIEPPAKTIVSPATEATIGETVTYRITVPGVPANAALGGVIVNDTLNTALVYDSATVTLNGAPLAVSPTQSGQALSWNLGAIPAGQQAVITLTARVANSDTTDAGDTFANTASYTYTGVTQPLVSLPTAAIRIIEPQVAVTKGVTPATPPTAGDVLTYTVNLTAAAGATRSGAFDTGLVDTLSLGLAYVSGTALIGSVAVEPTVTGDGVGTAQTLTWNGIDIPEGTTVTVTYYVRVLNSVGALQTLTNSVTARWTSLDGVSTFERTGTGTPAYNDYVATATASLTTPPDATTLAKTRLTDTFNAADANLRVGDLVDYELRIHLNEGSHTGLSIVDTLPKGLEFVQVVRVNGDNAAPYAATVPFQHSDVVAPAIAGTASTGPTTVTWTLGNIINAADNNTGNDEFVIVYRARVLNNDVFLQSPATQALDNRATLSYTTLAGTETRTDTESVSLVQPMLAVTKVAAPAGGDASIAAGEVVTYTVDIVNSGAAPAYDAVLVDTLPVGLRQGGVSVTSISLVNAGTNPPVLMPVYDATTGVATWNFDNGTADTYTIPAGDTLRVVYTVTADADIGDALTLTNAAVATLYYSFDNNAVPVNGSVDQREVYGPTNTATATLTTPAPALLKANTQPSAAVGQQFTYRVTVPASPVTTAMYDVRVLDDLSASAADLGFVSARIQGGTTLQNTGTSTNVILGADGSIDIPAGSQTVIEITVELLNTPANTVGLTFTNTADYTYNRIDNTPASQAAGQPGTSAPMQIIGVAAQKTVAIDPAGDSGTPGIVDPGDVLTYTITVSNPGVAALTNVVLTDDVPADTTFVAGSVTLNGTMVPDSGVSPLVAGMAINSTGAASGTLAAGASAVLTFKVRVNSTVATGTVISNQGYVTSVGLPTEPTDADGDVSNGYQPTIIVVGSAQQVAITKEVSVVGGGTALPGSELEYVVRVTNTGTVPATNLVITDDLTPLSGQTTYVAGSATLDGSATGVNYAAPVLTANYGLAYGNLMPGATTTLRFRVQIASGLPSGTRLTNTAQVAWSTGLSDRASAAIDIGGAVGSAILSGHAWHDANFDNIHDTGEANLAGWTVGLYRGNVQVASTTTDANGLYSFGGVAPTLTTAGQYELRFTAPGATTTTAKLGLADSVFTNGMQQISTITAVSGSNLQNLNLPIDPNGGVFSSISRTPIAGATVTLLHNGTPVASSCFSDPAQQNQVTLASGFYKFDLTYSDASCPLGGDYLINVTPPAGYTAGPSRLIPPVTHETTAAYDVATCSADAVPATAGYCEAYVSEIAPGMAVPASQISHYLHLRLSNPEAIHNQAYNNYLFVDAPLAESVSISKTASVTNVSRGQFVPYTITVTNTTLGSLAALQIVDTFPPGFKYVEGSARSNGLATEPARTNRTLTWDIPSLAAGEKLEIKLLFIVSSGVGEGEYVNRAQMFSSALGASGEASATVRVIPDATFDCTDVIGKVFDDANRNGYQDPGEKGLPNVRVATARGLLVTSDDHGRFHITCAVVPNEDRGSNFILKVDDRSLPTGYRITTENPRVQRATRGKMMKFNFGAALNKIVRIDVANGVFEPGTTEMRIQWKPRMDLLMGELKKAPSILRLAYMAEVEDEKLVEARLKALKQEIAARWSQQNGPYELLIETEVFWRTGAPPSRSALK